MQREWSVNPISTGPFVNISLTIDWAALVVFFDSASRSIALQWTSARTAYRATLDLARQEGIFVGSSGGAAAEAARQVASGLDSDAVVITLFPDSGERYLSKLNRRWMAEQGLLDEVEA